MREEAFGKLVQHLTVQSRTYRVIAVGEAFDPAGKTRGRATLEAIVFLQNKPGGGVTSGHYLSAKLLNAMILLTRSSSVSFGLAALLVLMLDSLAQGQPFPGTTSVQIVNATSVPAIALRINDRLAYESFPQGLKSADSPTSTLKATYEAEDKQTGRFAKSAEINYKPGTNQSLVILGDFSTEPPAGTLRRPGRALVGNGEQHPPSILFQVFSHAAKEAPVRVRIINGMPGKSLTFVAGRRGDSCRTR